MSGAGRLDEALSRLFRSFQEAEEAALRDAAPLDITRGEARVLAAVGTGAAKTMSQVAAELKISVGALSSAMNRLAKRSYVSRFRVPEDRRVVRLSLTPSGMEAVRGYMDFHVRAAERVLESMDGAQRALTFRVLESLDEHFRMQALRPLRRGPDLVLKPIRVGCIEIERPLFQGDMGAAFSSPELASAVARCGGVGVMTSSQPGFAEADYAENAPEANIRAMRRGLRAAREMAGGGAARAGAVAISVLHASSGYDAIVRAAVEAGAQMVISGAGIPRSLPGIVGDAGVSLVPVVSSVRAIGILRRSWAKKYDRAPDAVIFEGPGKSGLLGFKEEQLGDAEGRFYRTLLEMKRELDDLPGCPLIVANGPMGREEVEKAVSCGADGIQLEDRFASVRECGAPPAIREKYMDAGAADTMIAKSPLGMPVRILMNGLARRILAGGAQPARCIGCLDACPGRDIPFCLAEALAATARGDAENGIIFRAAGPRAGAAAFGGCVEDVFGEIFGPGLPGSGYYSPT
ncbi:MAG: nitronate monooxygenase [Clostridiales Family XIII bacterium]|jgi:NAD(P)H-dependent flavin oxidoreductase YrpB (nitropropane dioxygenase family)/DNA-binding MarR family transcriptional regulator|nr:nitronate monooxygenase [Clostridiales Family XIII bacterium]